MSNPLDRLHTYYDRTAILISLGTLSMFGVASAYYYSEIARTISSNNLYLVLIVVTTALLLTLVFVARTLYLRMIEEIREHQADILAAQSSLRDAYTGLMEALTSALDTRDHETHGHSIRVVVLALAIGERIGLTTEQRRAIIFGGLLHDIGKIGIPDAILFKPGPLTPDEMKTMKEHVEIGHRMVHGVRVLDGAGNVILYHHERWDGRGYPVGLKGEEIPTEARVFAVADAVDTMTSRRAYKEPMSLPEVYAEVDRCSGSHFCPTAARAFLELPKEQVVHV